MTRKILVWLLALLVLLTLSGCNKAVPDAPITASPTPAASQTEIPEVKANIDEEGAFTSARDVAAYLQAYNKLPPNFIAKAQARKLGWSGGDLRPYARDKSIGGDRFGNYEGLLPAKKGRQYYECDIDTQGKSARGAKRLVYSNDGLIYYTTDHYKSFTQLAGGD